MQKASLLGVYYLPYFPVYVEITLWFFLLARPINLVYVKHACSPQTVFMLIYFPWPYFRFFLHLHFRSSTAFQNHRDQILNNAPATPSKSATSTALPLHPVMLPMSPLPQPPCPSCQRSLCRPTRHKWWHSYNVSTHSADCLLPKYQSQPLRNQIIKLLII